MMPSSMSPCTQGGEIHPRDFRFLSGASRGVRLACLAMFVTNGTKGWEHATMSGMSASDAAPLPRLGEVFFDVRGSSRSMRLSWYSDTGVAVFSIWQGGTCTGTLRLSIDDLFRMVDALQRGPRGSGLPGGDAPELTGLPGGRSSQPGEAPAPYAEFVTGQHLAPVTGEFGRLDL